MSYNLDVKKISKEMWALNNCKEYAIYILTNYNKTEKKLREKLKQCKKYKETVYNDNIIDETIAFLKKHNFLNDENYATRFVELNKSKYSIKVIKMKLIEKGVNRDIIEKVLNEEDFYFDEKSVIKKLLLKKYPNYYDEVHNMDIKTKQKVFAYLFRKGFKYDDINEILKNF